MNMGQKFTEDIQRFNLAKQVAFNKQLTEHSGRRMASTVQSRESKVFPRSSDDQTWSGVREA